MRLVIYLLRRLPVIIASFSYIISMAVADYSGQAWLQGFNDIGQVIFGMTADQLIEIKVGLHCTRVLYDDY